MASDKEVLSKMIGDHAARTGSTTAKGLLQDPATLPSKFVKVVPTGELEPKSTTRTS